MIPERTEQQTAVVGGGVLAVFAVALYWLGSRQIPEYPSFFLLQAANLLLVSALVCFLAAFHALLVRLARVEHDAEAALAGKGGRLFANELDGSGRQQRALAQFEKVMLPVVLAVLSAAEMNLAWWVYRQQTAHPYEVLPHDLGPLLVASSTTLLFGVAAFFVGKYAGGLAFGDGRVLLRPVCAACLFAGGVCAGAAAVALSVYWGHAAPATAATTIGCLVAAVLAVERLVSWGVELYRPAARRGGSRAVYESRILGIFSQPRGMVDNLADIIDYQFGFTVSEHGFYRLLGRALLPLAALQVVTFLVLSSLVYVGPRDVAVAERWGRTELEQLGPGLYLRPPWPATRVARVPARRVQILRVSAGGTSATPPAEQRLWDDGSAGAALFLAGDRAGRDARNGVQKAAQTVNLAAATVAVRFTIADAAAFLTSHRQPTAMLQYLSHRALSSYLSSHDFAGTFADAGAALAAALRVAIQDDATAHGLGIRVLDVGVEALQPPAAAAPAFRAVMDAGQATRRLRAEADAYAHEALGRAQQDANRLVVAAAGETARITRMAEVENEIFTRQLSAFRVYRSLYETRMVMDALEHWLRDARKIVVTTGTAREVIEVELQRGGPSLLSAFEEDDK